MSVEQTLQERGARYGSFSEHAKIAQGIQEAFRIFPEKWNKLPPVQKQGLTVIADKIARMLNGDHMYEDNIHDIIGYAKLMEDWTKEQNNQKTVVTSVLCTGGVLRSDTSAAIAAAKYKYDTNDKN